MYHSVRRYLLPSGVQLRRGASRKHGVAHAEPIFPIRCGALLDRHVQVLGLPLTVLTVCQTVFIVLPHRAVAPVSAPFPSFPPELLHVLLEGLRVSAAARRPGLIEQAAVPVRVVDVLVDERAVPKRLHSRLTTSTETDRS